jgi:uncharacterized protein
VIVVSNSSPLIALARIGRLNLLASFYQRILVPGKVHHEVTVAGSGLPGADEICKASWIEVAPPRPPLNPSLEQECQSLGAGEREAILLAQSLPADLIVLDESKARRIARAAGLTVMGCLGVLEAGARKGFVPGLLFAVSWACFHGLQSQCGCGGPNDSEQVGPRKIVEDTPMLVLAISVMVGAFRVHSYRRPDPTSVVIDA